MTPITINPYLFFTGNCKEAMEFYKGVFGGELDLTPNEDQTMMHAQLSGGVISLMACDGDRRTPYEKSYVSLSLNGSDTEKLTALFNQLAEGGEITSGLKQEVWGDTFGTLTDKFSVDWMVNISAQ